MKNKMRNLSVRIAAGVLAGIISMGVGSIPVFAHGDDPASVSETDILPTEITVIDDADRKPTPYTPEGNMTLVDDIGSPNEPGKQFITVVSKKGNYFYIVIDRDKNGSENVHFMNLVDESDLLKLMEDDEIEAYTSTKKDTVSEDVSEKPAKEEPEKDTKKKNPIPALILLLAVFGGIGAYFIYQAKEKRKADSRKPDPDLDYVDEDEDFEYPDTTPEETDEDSETDE